MKNKIGIITIVCFIFGILFAVLVPNAVSSIEFIGTYYIKLLKLFITPVIFTSISYTIYKTRQNKSNILSKTVLLFVVMYVVTFLITSILVTLINPSKGYVLEEVEWSGTLTSFGIKNFFINLLPKNISDVFVNPKVFFVIILAYLFGRLVNSEKVFGVVEKIKDIIYKALEYVIYVSPIAVFSLIASTVSTSGSILLGVGLKYILCAYICSIVCVLLVMVLPVCIKCNIGPLQYIKKIYKIWIMTVSTCSSAAVLPYTIKLCNEELNIPKSVTDVVVPLGCTIHMCGGAVSFSLLGLFCASMYGVHIGIQTFVIMVVSSLLINMAAPGIPGGGIVIGASFLNLLGIPLNFIGFYAGIYKLLDMCYTTLNVTGDISANMLINKSNNY